MRSSLSDTNGGGEKDGHWTLDKGAALPAHLLPCSRSPTMFYIHPAVSEECWSIFTFQVSHLPLYLPLLLLPPSPDCPQVQAVYDYHAQQPDELDLERGDVVKVYRKMADGKELAFSIMVMRFSFCSLDISPHTYLITCWCINVAMQKKNKKQNKLYGAIYFTVSICTLLNCNWHPGDSLGLGSLLPSHTQVCPMLYPLRTPCGHSNGFLTKFFPATSM